MNQTIICSNPFNLHAESCKATSKTKSKFRPITEFQAQDSPIELIVGHILCDKCRNHLTVVKKQLRGNKSKVVECCNPFLKHATKRKKGSQYFHKVTREFAAKCANHNIILSEGQRLCMECRLEATRTLRGSQHQTIFCADPRGNHKKPRKNSPLFAFGPATVDHVNICLSLNLNLSIGDQLCAHCRRDIIKQKKSSPPASPIVVPTSPCHSIEKDDNISMATVSSSDYNSNVEDEDSEYSDDEVRLDKLNRAFSALQLPPVDKSLRTSDKKLKETLSTAKLKVSNLFMKFAGRNVDIDHQKNRKCTCKPCDDYLNAIKAKLDVTTIRSEKYKLLTCTPMYVSIKDMQIKFGISKSMAEAASKLRHQGPMVCKPPRIGKKLSPDTEKLVIEFYQNPDNSRTSPHQRDTLLVTTVVEGNIVKERKAKQEIMMTLKDLYDEFIQKYPNNKISISKFSKLRPQNCKWGGSKGFHKTCLCIYHTNFSLLRDVLKLEGSTNDVLSLFYCGINENCLLGKCDNCPRFQKILEILANWGDDSVEFYQWSNSNGQHSMEISKQTLGKEEFLTFFQSSIVELAEHQYVHIQQKAYISNLKVNIIAQQPCGVLNSDFGENYSFVVSNEVQSFHWVNNQATVHRFVFHYYCRDQKVNKHLAFVVISDCLSHGATAFHVFRARVIEILKKKFSWLQMIHYVSDGAASHYKCRKNFVNLFYHEKEFGLKATWTFFATAHGKDLCDAMSAVAKRSTRLESLRRTSNHILKPIDMYNFLNSNMATEIVKYLFVSEEEIEAYSVLVNLNARYLELKTVPGTRSFHEVQTFESSALLFKKVSNSTDVYKHTIKAVNHDSESAAPSKDYKRGYYVGYLKGSCIAYGIIEEVDSECGDIKLRSMRKSPKKGFYWCDPPKFDWIPVVDIVGKMAPPSTTNGRVYEFAESDLNIIALNARITKTN